MNSNGFDMFQNSGYVNNRNRKRTLILDIEDSAANNTHLGSGGEFNIQLYEPMIIDKHSEVYLDNFTTFNSLVASSPATCGFRLHINEFNMNSNVASTDGETATGPGGGYLFNSLIIPNEHRTPGNNHTSVVHKGKKFNYVCDINPQTISSLSGRITSLDNNPIFHGNDPLHLFTYTISGLDPESLQNVIAAGVTFAGMTNVNGVGGATVVSGSFLFAHETSTTELHFSTNIEITALPAVSDVTAITFTGCSGDHPTITVANASGANQNMLLITGSARLIAEFSIISRE